MDTSPTLEPAYLNLPGWRCVPVYALPLSPTSRSSPNRTPTPPLETHNLLPPNIPPDPRQWSRQNVFSWLEWCVEHFSLSPLDIDQFYMNGRGLCLLKKGDFCERAHRSGDVLFNALQVLLHSKEKATQQGISASLLQQHALQEKACSARSWPRSISTDYHSVGHVIHESEHAPMSISHLTGSDVDSTTASSPSPPEDADKSPERGNMITLKLVPYLVSLRPFVKFLLVSFSDALYSNSNHSQSLVHVRQLTSLAEDSIPNPSEKINVRLLWDFLQQLLNDSQQRYNCCIVWKDRSRGIFKITDPHRLAALWGKQKNHLNMNFDKMSRALRYYYRVRILQKEPGERHCYRFLRHPNELRHCKQRSLLLRDAENIPQVATECSEIETALDMSIKEEGSPANTEGI